VTDEDIDRDRLVVVGWSRMGKAAIVAAAFDERIALAIPHQAGCGGTAPSRAAVGESVLQINRGNPHWFADAFKQFNEQPSGSPSIRIAWSPWSPPARPPHQRRLGHRGQPRGAIPGPAVGRSRLSPVRRGGAGCREDAPVNTLVSGTLGFHIRPGSHSMGREDWAIFLRYADIRFGRLGPGAAGIETRSDLLEDFVAIIGVR